MYHFEDFGIKFEKTILKNGSRLFLFSKKGAPLYVRAIFNAGTRWNEIPGTAHFTEHMLVAGSKKFPTKDLLSWQIEKTGGSFSANTGIDWVSINIQVPLKEDLPVVFDVLNEMLNNSLFDLQTIEKERGAILAELGSKKSNPKMRLTEVLYSLVFQGSSLEFSNLGTEESIKQIGKKEIKDFYNKYFSNSRLAYVVCGDINIDELKDALENSINLSSVADNSFQEILQIKREKVSAVEYFDNKETNLSLGFRVDAPSFQEMASLFIVNNILTGGRASILTTKLRYEKGLVYNVSGLVKFPFNTGVFSISTACSNDNAQKVIDIISNELNNIFTNGVDEKMFEFAKEKILKGIFIDMQISESWVNRNEFSLVGLNGVEANIVDFMNIIEKTTVGDVNNVFRKYIKPNSSYLAVCGKNENGSLIVEF